MLPSHDSPVIFLLAIGPAMFLAVILHELGHVLAARSVGMEVAAWGVGYRRPWFYFNIGSSVFYLGRPLTGGMMTHFPRKLEREPVKEFIMVLGGPLASLFGLVIGIAAVCLGQRSGVTYAWTYVSAIYVFLSFVPFTFTSQSFRFVNDAKRLIHILRRGGELMAVPVGPALSSAQALAELMTAIKCDSGLSNSYCSIATLQSALGDAASARTSLAVAMESKHYGPIFFFARSAVAVAENLDDAETVFATAREQCQGDATAEFLIDILHEQWRLKRKCGNPDQRERLRQRAFAASRLDWMCWIECLNFQAEVVDDVESRCRTLLRDYREQLEGVARARLLALTSERLATKGDLERAVIVFQEAQATIYLEAVGIASEITRNAFLQSASEPLQRVAKLANIDAPRFDDCPIQYIPYRRRVFAMIAFALGSSAFVAGALLSVLVLVGAVPSDSGFAIALGLPAVLGAMLGLFAGMISILRSESNRWRLLWTALPLAFLALMVVGFGLSR